MKCEDALHEVDRIAFDTVPLIYFVEKHPIYFEKVSFIMRCIDSGSLNALSSTLILAELLVHPLRLGNIDLIKRYETILTYSKGFQLVSVNTSIARLAADLRASYNLKTPDVIHVATAIDTGCQAFLTNDITLKRIKTISILLLDEMEL